MSFELWLWADLGPATFQGAMNTTLAPLLRKCVLVFFDGILIYGRTYEEHVSHVAQVLELLQKDQWKVEYLIVPLPRDKLPT